MRDSEYIPKKQTIHAISLLSLAFAFGVSKAHSENTGNPAEIQQIRQSQKRYVASIDGANLALVDQVWSHSPDVIFVEPLGTERGLLQVAGFVRDTFGKMFSKRDLQLENPSIHVYGDTAWSEMTWTFHATIRDGEKPLVTKGRETQILRKEDGAWHIIAIHYSGLPVNGKLQGF
jgi:ketosteroid isomerase-like protein